MVKKKKYTGLLASLFLLFYTFPVHALVGDMDGSGKVDGNDLALFSLTFGAEKRSPTWAALADFVGNGIVDGEDLSFFAPNFGRSSVGSVAARIIWKDDTSLTGKLGKSGYASSNIAYKVSDISKVFINISASGMQSVSEEFFFDAKEGILSGVPAGEDRVLTVYGRNASGTNIFRGITTITVEAGETTNVSLYATKINLESKRTPLLSAGDDQSFALTADGNLWGWGLNNWGQLGDGTVENARIPVHISQMTELIGVIDVDSGFDNSVALKYDGTLWSWGYNDFGQLGNGDETAIFDSITSYEMRPVQVMADTSTFFNNVTALSAGGYHVLAVKTDGQVWAWGHNSDWQLGNNTITDSAFPVEVPVSSAQSVSAGAFHSTALQSDGTLLTWGQNSYGQLGDGAISNLATPYSVLTSVEMVSAGYYHTVVLKRDGTVWAWGNKEYGQVGDGTIGDGHPLSTTDSDRVLSPVMVNISGVISIAGGGEHTLALKSDKTVWAWGSRAFGQLGDGKGGFGNKTTIVFGDYTSAPIQVKGPGGTGFLSNIVDIEAGWRHSLAIESDGTVWAWGENEFGQLGNDTEGDGDSDTVDNISVTPVQVLNLSVN